MENGLRDIQSTIKRIRRNTDKSGFADGALTSLGFYDHPRRNRSTKAPKRKSGRTISRSRRAPAAQGTSRKAGAAEHTQKVAFRVDPWDQAVSFILPANPALWADSPLYNTAKMYQYYRIERLTVHWVPSCSTSTSGSVTIGHMPLYSSPLVANLASELATSAGGVAGPMWQDVEFVVPSQILPSDWLKVRSSVGAPSWPFNVFVHRTNVAADLGYLEIDATYKFFGPSIGRCGVFTNQGLVSLTTTDAGSTQATWDVNIGSLAVATGDVDIGDIVLAPGDMLVVTALGASDTYFRANRNGLTMTDTDIDFAGEKFLQLAYSRSGE